MVDVGVESIESTDHIEILNACNEAISAQHAHMSNMSC